jgi:hypothetical protein
MSGEAPEGIPLDVWLAANWVDVACQKNSCRDEGCNGFLCARAIRATYERGSKEGIEEAAKVAASGKMYAHVTTGEPPTVRPIEHRDLIAAAIRSLGEKT